LGWGLDIKKDYARVAEIKRDNRMTQIEGREPDEDEIEIPLLQ